MCHYSYNIRLCLLCTKHQFVFPLTLQKLQIAILSCTVVFVRGPFCIIFVCGVDDSSNCIDNRKELCYGCSHKVQTIP